MRKISVFKQDILNKMYEDINLQALISIDARYCQFLEAAAFGMARRHFDSLLAATAHEKDNIYRFPGRKIV